MRLLLARLLNFLHNHGFTLVVISLIVGGVGLFTMLVISTNELQDYRHELFQNCLADRLPAYECYGKIYGGRR